MPAYGKVQSLNASTGRQPDRSSVSATSDNIYRALSKVIFADASNLADSQIALFNPTELSPETSARINKLEPIGFTSNPKGYGGTNDTSFSMTLEYSREAFSRFGIGKDYQSFMAVQAWFNSFLYPSRPGRAPDRMFIIWPNTMTLRVILESVGVTFRQWDQRLRVRDYAITLRFCEDSTEFNSSRSIRAFGYNRHEADTFQVD